MRHDTSHQERRNYQRTLFEKIWASHVVKELADNRSIIHIDRHVMQEGTSRRAFQMLTANGLRVRNPELTFGVIDHSVSTAPGRTDASFEPSRYRIVFMRENCKEAGIRLFDIDDPNQGIEHVVAPELGIALPGCTLVCGDSHTATNGGLGAWAWGIGTTEVGHVLATQTLIVRKPKTMRVRFEGSLPAGIYAKDLILYLIGRYGIAAGSGYSVEYAGEAIRAMPIEGRLTICNMSIEFGARAGLVAVDDATLQYVAGRSYAPQGASFDLALAHWRTLHSDPDAGFDAEIGVDCSVLKPQVSWGTSVEHVIPVDGRVPDPAAIGNAEQRRTVERALAYIGLVPGQTIEGTPVDVAFIGSCTNARLSDLEAAAEIVRGGRVANGVRALVSPGSTAVKRAAEAKGLDEVFRAAGFEWRESACSMCVATNGDVVPSGQRCIATSNRNFENRQGPGSRTHLASPASVAAAALTGRITDVRKLLALAG